MKINDILILNWKAPGDEFWARAEQSPDEPLIEARMDLTLSDKEYKELLAKQDRSQQGIVIPPGSGHRIEIELHAEIEQESDFSERGRRWFRRFFGP